MRTAVLLLAMIPAVAELRTWTDSTGRHTTRAELLEAHGDVAYLRNNGKVKGIPFAKLSAADQQFIRKAFPVETLTGKVVGIADGDTFTLLDANKQQHRIRIEGIDAPESKQDYGTKSREALADKIFQKDVTVEWSKRDRYGRILGNVIADGRWLDREHVADGWAWHFKSKDKSIILAEAESEARKAKRGLWADNEPTPPWLFRKPPAEPRPPPIATAAALTPPRPQNRSAPAVTVFVADTGKKYHRETCRFVKRSKQAMSLSDALSGGYEPCKVCNPPTR